MEAAFAATGAFNDKLQADGYWVFAGGLAPATTSTVVDGQGPTPVMTDGPYLETKEALGGFWVIDDLTSMWHSGWQPRGPRRAVARSRSVRSTVLADQAVRRPPAISTSPGAAGAVLVAAASRRQVS